MVYELQCGRPLYYMNLLKYIYFFINLIITVFESLTSAEWILSV